MNGKSGVEKFYGRGGGLAFGGGLNTI